MLRTSETLLLFASYDTCRSKYSTISASESSGTTVDRSFAGLFVNRLKPEQEPGHAVNLDYEVTNTSCWYQLSSTAKVAP
jgi:hypothetical protein